MCSSTNVQSCNQIKQDEWTQSLEYDVRSISIPSRLSHLSSLRLIHVVKRHHCLCVYRHFTWFSFQCIILDIKNSRPRLPIYYKILFWGTHEMIRMRTFSIAMSVRDSTSDHIGYLMSNAHWYALITDGSIDITSIANFCN